MDIRKFFSTGAGTGRTERSRKNGRETISSDVSARNKLSRRQADVAKSIFGKSNGDERPTAPVEETSPLKNDNDDDMRPERNFLHTCLMSELDERKDTENGSWENENESTGISEEGFVFENGNDKSTADSNRGRKSMQRYSSFDCKREISHRPLEHHRGCSCKMERSGSNIRNSRKVLETEDHISDAELNEVNPDDSLVQPPVLSKRKNATVSSDACPQKILEDQCAEKNYENSYDNSEDLIEEGRPKKLRKSPNFVAMCDDNEKCALAIGVEGHIKSDSSSAAKRFSPPKRTRVMGKSTSQKRVRERLEPIIPVAPVDAYNLDCATPGCLEGYTFVFSGVLPNLGRQDAEDYVKILGGRVTKSVSSNSHYLVCGNELEDGRPVAEGAKHRRAAELGGKVCAIINGKQMLYALVKMLDGKHRQENSFSMEDPEDFEFTNGNESGRYGSTITTLTQISGVNPTLSQTATSTKPFENEIPRRNPYADKMTFVNPYNANALKAPAKKSFGKDTRDNLSEIQREEDLLHENATALWADKYAPRSSSDILGNQDNAKKLALWLGRWESTFNKVKSNAKTFNAPNGLWKAALLSGPPGIGKTSTANCVVKESGRTILEMNASDIRSKKMLSDGIGDFTGSQVLHLSKEAVVSDKKRCVIMDEVDGMGAGDRSGMAELIRMVKCSMVPIVCICNDRQSQKLRSLAPYCLDLKFRRPTKFVIAKHAVDIGRKEGMTVEINAAEAIAESCGNDIRQVLNCLHMWSSKRSGGRDTKPVPITYRDIKEREMYIQKDELLRVSIFDATKLIVEGCRGVNLNSDRKSLNDSFFKRSDAFFTDYALMGLNVHQNYLKVMIGQIQEAKRKSNAEVEIDVINRMFEAAKSMSDFAVAEEAVRSQQSWQVLPLCAILAVKVGHHGGGESGSVFPGYPEFAGWLGKNSTRGKKSRLLQELRHHMNYSLNSDTRDLRLWYLPVVRKHLMTLLNDPRGPRTFDLIEFMDEYGLDRDDIFEKFDNFALEQKHLKFTDLDSKAKAAFTRSYNMRAHKSQALVEEQGLTLTRKGKTGKVDEVETTELDVIDEDMGHSEEEDKGHDMRDEAIKQLFRKKVKAAEKSSKNAKKKSVQKKK